MSNGDFELIVRMNATKLGPMVSSVKMRAYKAFSERLALVARQKGIEQHGMQSEIARMAGVSPRAARKWLQGDAMPDMGHGAILANKLEVSFNWLMADQGPMKLPKTVDPEGMAIALSWSAISEDVKNVMRGILRHAINPSNPGFSSWEKYGGSGGLSLQEPRTEYSKNRKTN